MADCVVSSIVDTDLDRVVPACVVHAAHAPCPHNGEPACPTPLHTHAYPSREEAIAFWVQRTHRLRPLVLHHGDLGECSHDTTAATGADCWCGPEVLGGIDG